jgi:DNA-binding transcriptional LysR family regulator
MASRSAGDHADGFTCASLQNGDRSLRKAEQLCNMQKLFAFSAKVICMLDALPTFVAVAACGSFSLVARAQDVAVSSVTRRIDQLETTLGVKLFTRSSRHLALTDAGELLLPRARRILAEVDDAKHGLSALYADPRGTLTVTAPTMFGRRHIAGAIIDFLALYPLLEVDLHLSDAFVDLAERRVDVAIRIGQQQGGDLITTQLAPFRRMVCASPSYLERAGCPQTPSDLLIHNCLTLASMPHPAGWWTFDGINRGLHLNVHGNFRSDDTGILLQAAVAGVGIVHLASWLVHDMIVAGKLVPILPNARSPASVHAAIHAVRMPGRSDTAKARAFISHLRKTFGSPPYWEQGI